MNRRARRIMAISSSAMAWLGANLIAWGWLSDAEFFETYGVLASVDRRFERLLPAGGEMDIGPAEIPFRLWIPHRRDEGQKFPLIVYLHGSGDRGGDGVRPLGGAPSVLADRFRDSPTTCFILVPQCPLGWRWPSAVSGDENRNPDPLAGTIFAAIDRVCEEHPIDRRRVHLVGYSMGGQGVCELAALDPQRFATVVAIAGAGDVSLASRLRGTPCLFIHGRDDTVAPFVVSEKLHLTLLEEGGASELWELAGVGHGAWRPECLDYARVVSWLNIWGNTP